MNEHFDEDAGSPAPRDDGNFAPRSARPGASGNGHNSFSSNGRAAPKTFDFWTVADIFAHRWHWLVVGGILAAGAFFMLGWSWVEPKFTGVADLLRYETPGTSESLKTTPLTSETFASLLASPDLLRRVAARSQPTIAPDELARRLKVDPQVESDVVKVFLVATTPQEAVALANLYAAEATNFTRELQATQAAAVADTYLKQQVADMDGDITTLISQFRGMPGSSRASTNLAKIGNDLSALGQNPATSPQSAFLINELSKRLQTALVDLSDLTVKYTDENPLVQSKRAQIDSIKSQLNQSTGAENGRNTVIDLTGQAIQPDVEVIRAKLRALEDSRVTLQTKQREAELFATNPPGTARVLAEANLKTVRSGHRRIKIGMVTIFGGALGTGFTLLLIFLIEVTDRRLRTANDVRRVTHLPVLTTLGDLGAMQEYARTQWAFRNWTLLQGRLSRSQNHGLVCGVTSSTEGEGRSTWISMLAEAASLAGFRVLTIATRPSPMPIESPHELTEDTLNDPSDMNANPEYNNPNALTSNVLASPAQVTEKLTDPNSRPVVHIPLPGWVWNLERRKQWRDALDHWRKIENLVIFVELPPASVPEAVLLGANLPNLVWLSSSGIADAAETRTQLETLRNARCNLVGAVLNREPARSIKGLFPRWVSCFVLLAALSLCTAQAQTPPVANPSPAVPQVANPEPETADTNTILLTEPPATVSATLESPTNYSFSVVSASQRADWQRNLTLGPADVLSFALYGEPTLVRTEVAIGPDGRISFLEAQDVMATGLTVDGLRQKVDEALGKYRRSPRTVITPVAYRSKRYYVLGKVVQRGVYVLDRPVTILEALARAKGIESGQVDYDIVDVADLQHTFLMRQSKRIPVDFERLFENGDLSQNVQIEPGDYLYFPSTDVKQVYVLGEVGLPGPVTYRPDMTVLGAISSRGGFNEKAFKSHVLVVRGSLNHPETFIADTMGTTSGRLPDFRLQPKDIVYVTWRPFYRGEQLLDLAATAFVQSAVNGWVGTTIVTP